MPLIPVSAIIPTLDRRDRLVQTLAGMLRQDFVPAEIIVIDASADPIPLAALAAVASSSDLAPRLHCEAARVRGAAAQRNQGSAIASQPFLLYLDNDIDLAPNCLASLWETMSKNPRVGGCGAMSTNQHYHPPGRFMRSLYRLLGCPAEESLSGRMCGPALNFLPAEDGPTKVEWLNLCCTLYRREALPDPPFLAFFSGYSLMEDAALAWQVGQRWQLVVPAGARAFHDSRVADYKDRVFRRERMEYVNRWFVLTRVMGRTAVGWQSRFLLHQLLMLGIPLRRFDGWQRLPAAVAGKLAGLVTVALHARHWRGYLPRL